MSKAKLSGQKTPLLPLSWVTTRGQGKMKKNDPLKPLDENDPSSYNYCATVTMSKEQAESIKKVFDKFWRENKPAGVGKQKYEVVKEEFVKVLDAEGKPKVDEDDEPIKEATGKWTMLAKTLTVWPDGNTNVVKLLGSNGSELQEGHALEKGCGDGTMGILHYSVGINNFADNEGLQVYLNGVQIKDSSFTEYTGGDAEINADSIDDDVAEADVPDTTPSGENRPVV